MGTVASFFAQLLLAMGLIQCPNPTWTDPAGDVYADSGPPAFDLIGIQACFEPHALSVELVFNPATVTPSDFYQLNGSVDFQPDVNLNTGVAPHINQFDPNPEVDMSGDYFVAFIPTYDAPVCKAELWRATMFDWVVEETFICECAVLVRGTTVEVKIPRCPVGPCSGLPIGPRFLLSAIIGNNETSSITDRAPNDNTPYKAGPARPDFDEDGDVDAQDIGHFRACCWGPNIPQSSPACKNADFDNDDDVDQDDFSLLQLEYTGPLD